MIKKAFNIFGLIQFWGWNFLGVFLAVLLVGYAVLPFVIMATFNGEIPLSITVCTLLLFVIPFIGIFWGIKRFKVTLPFFYGVQIPLVGLLLLRLFAVRELTLGTSLMIGGAIAACMGFCWWLWKSPKNPNPEALTGWRSILATFITTLIAITGLYIGVYTLLYTIPIGAEIIREIFSSDWNWFEYFDLFFLILFMFYCMSIFCFLLFPFYIAYYYPIRWWKTFKSGLIPKTKFLTLSGMSLAIIIALFSVSQLQPHVAHFNTLKNQSPAELRVEMENPERVRKTLLNTYLHEYRYLGNSDRNGLQRMYQDAFGSKGSGAFAQNTHNFMIAPFLYRGGHKDSHKADALYETLFDVPIQRVEQKPITKALQATYNRDAVTAGLMNIGLRNVLLKEQNVTVRDLGSHAEIEIEEIYENLTFENQEIFYYFALPEDAAITGIWIGRTDDREKMDKYIVAPRGAAQKVYEAQVVRNIDPALLEQVGPGQYRLRLFPIPVTSRRAQFDSRSQAFSQARENYMRMHLRYVTPNKKGKFALPALLEKRNVNWSRKTRRSLNGKAIKVKDSWMSAPYIDAGLAEPESLTINLGGQNISKRRVEHSVNQKVPTGNYAVIIDSSYSMRAYENDLKTNLEKLQNLETSAPDLSLIYFIYRADRKLVPISSPLKTDLDPYGSITLQDMIFSYQNQGETHDGLILLTDQNRYGVTTGIDDITLDIPLWIIPQKKAPAAYDDNILDLIYRNRGAVISNIDDFGLILSHKENQARIINGDIWSVEPGEATEIIKDKSLSALAARQLILARSYGIAPTPESLDQLHTIAKKYEVVTPYSSMIVLVNESQKQQLEKASQSEDRFDRESRSGKEFLTTPSPPSAVPEPHEWVLIFISLILLVWLWRRRDDFGGFAKA